MPTIVSVRELRARLSELMGRASYGDEEIIISKNGSEHVALIGYEQLKFYHDLEDQLDLLLSEKSEAEAREQGHLSPDDTRQILGLADEHNTSGPGNQKGSEENRSQRVAEDSESYN